MRDAIPDSGHQFLTNKTMNELMFPWWDSYIVGTVGFRESFHTFKISCEAARPRLVGSGGAPSLRGATSPPEEIKERSTGFEVTMFGR